jgi:hypothetical protein
MVAFTLSVPVDCIFWGNSTEATTGSEFPFAAGMENDCDSNSAFKSYHGSFSCIQNQLLRQISSDSLGTSLDFSS